MQYKLQEYNILYVIVTATSKCRLFTAIGGPYPDGLACYSPEPSKLADVHARHKRRKKNNKPA